jgi:hypothetical protein
LVVSGRAAFSRSGKVTIPTGSKTGQVAAPLGTDTLVLATIQSGAVGVYLRASKPTVSTQRITFYLNVTAPSPIAIAWMVIN